MKYFKIIFIWTSLAVMASLIIKWANPEMKGNGIYILFAGIGLIIGLVYALLSYFSAHSKEKIFKEAIKMYNGKKNIYSETELAILRRSVILDYKFEQTGRSVAEYIIAQIDVTDLIQILLKNCPHQFEIEQKRSKYYAVIYSSWGYKGVDFKTRVKQKIQELNACKN